MLAGLKPYSGLYETKPPGIYFLSAISFKLAGNAVLTNILCVICLLITAAAPLAAVIIHRKKSSLRLPCVILYSGAVLFGLITMMYSQLRSGGAQIENIGTGFAIIYLLLISSVNADTPLVSPKIWVSSLFFMMSVMMKEPFLLVCVSGAVLLTKNAREFLRKLILPAVSGGLLGVLLLTLTGTLVPYLRFYLPNMMGGHISRYGSFWKRGLSFGKPLSDMQNFSPGLMMAVLLLLVPVIVIIFQEQRQDRDENGLHPRQIVNIIKPFLAIYLTSVAVGLGGQYFNHHFIFAMPLYFTFFLVIVIYFKNISETGTARRYVLTGIVAGVCISCAAGICLLPEHHYNKDEYSDTLESMHAQADYVDDLLRAAGEDEYHYLGFNGNRFYCFTEQSPKGPLFIQDQYNFLETDNWFSETLKEQLDSVNILIVEVVNLEAMNDYVNEYINVYFTETPPPETVNIQKPPEFNYRVLYRNKYTDFK